MYKNTLQKDLSDALDRWDFSNNVLEEYDNVTYNIRFYMISKSLQDNLSNTRHNNQKNSNIDLKEKYIIAETGVSTKYSIDELMVKSILNGQNGADNVINYEMSMTLTEVNDCSLVNNISVVSKMLGYDSELGRPYHVDVWFSGYDHISKRPIQQIGDIYTFETIINDVKTKVSDKGTTYDIKMTPKFSEAFKKEINIMADKGLIKSENGLFSEMIKSIEKNLNDYDKKINPNKSKSSNNTSTSGSNKTYKIIVYDYTNSENGVDITNDKSIRLYPNTTPKQDLDSIKACKIDPDKNDVLIDVIQRLCHMTDKYRSCVVDINALCSADIENNSVSKPMTITYRANIRKSLAVEKQIDNKNVNKDNIKQKFLDEMKKNNSLKKKYEYMFSRSDTSVLEVKIELDNLWYMNLPYYELEQTIDSSVELKEKETDKNKIKTEMDNSNNEQKNSNVNKYASLLQNARSSNGLYYVDDICDNIGSNYEKIIEDIRIPTKVSQLNSTPDKTAEVNDKNVKKQVQAINGWGNVFRTGSMVELKMKILGDPYWLKIPSDDSYYTKETSNPFIQLYFILRTGLHQDPNDKTGYNVNGLIRLSAIYNVVTITNVFTNGKFTQDLECVITPEMLE